MKSLPVADFKTHFYEILNKVKLGEEFVACDGQKNEKVAVLIPYKNDVKKPVKLGVLEGIATYTFRDDFKMAEQEFLNS